MCLRDFLRDVKARINEVTNREYIDPGRGTVDYVLLFIPNESVYAFIHEKDSTVLEMALQKKVICCSPLTLYAVLAVVRQAVDNFALEQTSKEIISLFGLFYVQWDKFITSMESLGKRIASAQDEFDKLSGTRRRALERPLGRIEQLRKQSHIPVAESDEETLGLSPGDEDSSLEDGVASSFEVVEEEES